MKNLLRVFVIAGATCLFCSTLQAAYTVNGHLDDWGVTPFSHWGPSSSTADFHVADDENEYNAMGYMEVFDFEAFYFDDNAENLYIAVVTSRELGYSSPGGGDLGFCFDGDYFISTHGIVTGLEYAIKISQWGQLPFGQNVEVWKDPVWVSTVYTGIDPEFDEQGSPWYAQSGTVVGTAYAEIYRYDDLLDDLVNRETTILELVVSRSLFPTLSLGNVVFGHISQECGNDSINLTGYIDVPEPAIVLLFGLATLFAPVLRQSRRGTI
jgi:hypothetical protein